MNQTTRFKSALVLWLMLMAIFMFSAPLRPVRAFSYYPTRTTSLARTQPIRSSSLFAISSKDLRESKDSIPVPPSNSLSPLTLSEKKERRKLLLTRKRQWIARSTAYYSTVMRNESRRARGQINPSNQDTLVSHEKGLIMAQKIYFARNKIKSGSLNHAEFIYRKLIDELILEEDEDEDCDHAQLAISTLLLALLLQRKKNMTETRSVFERFFTIIHRNVDENDMECSCSAKVLQAYALFEMKQGNVKKAYRLATMAVRMDGELHPLLQWKQFRDAKELSLNDR